MPSRGKVTLESAIVAGSDETGLGFHLPPAYPQLSHHWSTTVKPPSTHGQRCTGAPRRLVSACHPRHAVSASAANHVDTTVPMPSIGSPPTAVGCTSVSTPAKPPRAATASRRRQPRLRAGFAFVLPNGLPTAGHAFKRHVGPRHRHSCLQGTTKTSTVPDRSTGH